MPPGRRFVDEGADFRNYTYAKYGAVVLRQPHNFAYQVFDNKIIPMLRDEYRIRRVSKVSANTIEELANKLEGVDPQAFLDEIRTYNAAVRKDVTFNPNIKDGRCTEGLAINKSNWANTIEDGPFEAYQVGCGVSFTFGGVRVDPEFRPGDRHRHEPDPRPLCGRRTRRRHLLLQLSGRLGPDLRRRVRPHRGHRRGRRQRLIEAQTGRARQGAPFSAFRRR